MGCDGAALRLMVHGDGGVLVWGFPLGVNCLLGLGVRERWNRIDLVWGLMRQQIQAGTLWNLFSSRRRSPCPLLAGRCKVSVLVLYLSDLKVVVPLEGWYHQ